MVLKSCIYLMSAQILFIVFCYPTMAQGVNPSASKAQVQPVSQEIHLEIVDGTSTLDINIYDVRNNNNLVYSGTATSNAIWQADADASNQQFVDADLTSNTLYKISIDSDSEFSIEYLYYQCNSSGQTVDLQTDGFFCPNTPEDSGNADLRLEYNDGTMTEWVSGFRNSQTPDMSDHFSDENWMIPYNVETYCNPNCGLGGVGKISFFLTPQTNASDFTFTDDDLTVPSNRTWDFNNMTYRFPTNLELLVNGTLKADGSTFRTTSTTWDGIRFASGSGGTLKNSTVQNISGTAITITSSSPTLHDNTITGGTTSIYVSGSSSEPEIYDNTITKNMYFNNGGGFVHDNTLSSGGIYASHYGDPNLDTPVLGEKGNNQISGGGVGLSAETAASIWTGSGDNCITSPTNYHVQVLDGGSVNAENNWWGGSAPTTSNSGGTIDTTPYDTGSSCPIPGSAAFAKTGGEVLASGATWWDQLRQARVLSKRGAALDASTLLKTLIASAPNPEAARVAFIQLSHVQRVTKDLSLLAFLEAEAKQHATDRSTLLGALIDGYATVGQSSQAMELAELVVKENPNSWQATFAKFRLFWLHLEQGERRQAEAYLAAIEPKREVDWLEYNLAKEALGTDHADIRFRTRDQAVLDEPQNGAQIEVYPNPFNPVTTFRYTVPLQTRVLLKIYDSLGREVRTLVNGSVAAGEHVASFEANTLPSGMYLYRMEAEEIVQTGTILLVK